MTVVVALVVRFIVFAAILAIAARIGDYFWLRSGLGEIAALQGYHDAVFVWLGPLALVLALLAPVARPVAIFVLFFAVGAMLTAPYAFARLLQ